MYYVGAASAQKINALSSNPFNYGFDDDRGDYNIVMHDHIAYRYELLDKLG